MEERVIVGGEGEGEGVFARRDVEVTFPKLVCLLPPPARRPPPQPHVDTAGGLSQAGPASCIPQLAARDSLFSAGRTLSPRWKFEWFVNGFRWSMF